MQDTAVTSGHIDQPRPSRDQEIEVLRILSAFGIVAYHADAAWHDVVYGGLVVFLMLAPMVDAQFNWERVRSFRALAMALILPWAFWSLIYGVGNIATHKSIFPAPGAFGMLMGTSFHLWFLPFMFFVLLGLNFLKSRCSLIVLFRCSVIISGTFLATAGFWRPLTLEWPLPLPQWMHAVPAVFVGITIGVASRIGKGGIIGSVIIAAALSMAAAAQLPGLSVTYSIGILTVVLVVFTRGKWFPSGWSVQSVASCMMGVYLIHILILAIFSRVTGPGTYMTVTITFLVSLAIVWTARRFLPMSRLVLG